MINDDKTDKTWTNLAGANVGTEIIYIIPEHDSIAKIIIWHDSNSIQGLKFITNGGNETSVYGSSSGTEDTFEITGNLTGFYGKADIYLRQLGAITR